MKYSYMYEAGSSSTGSVLTTIFFVYSVFLLIWGVISIGSYILRGIGFYTIAKSQGDENAWLAFIPFVRKYQQGELAGDILLKKKSIKNTGIWFFGLPIAWGIISYLVSMIMGISVAGKIIQYGVMSSYGRYDLELEDFAVILIIFMIIYTLLSVLYQAAYKVLVIVIDSTILSRYTTGNMPMIHAVLCAFIPLYESICIFVMSRRIVDKRTDGNMGYQNSTPYGMPYGDTGFTAEAGSGMTEVSGDTEPLPSDMPGDIVILENIADHVEEESTEQNEENIQA